MAIFCETIFFLKIGVPVISHFYSAGKSWRQFLIIERELSSNETSFNSAAFGYKGNCP